MNVFWILERVMFFVVILKPFFVVFFIFASTLILTFALFVVIFNLLWLFQVSLSLFELSSSFKSFWPSLIFIIKYYFIIIIIIKIVPS